MPPDENDIMSVQELVGSLDEREAQLELERQGLIDAAETPINTVPDLETAIVRAIGVGLPALIARGVGGVEGGGAAGAQAVKSIERFQDADLKSSEFEQRQRERRIQSKDREIEGVRRRRAGLEDKTALAGEELKQFEKKEEIRKQKEIEVEQELNKLGLRNDSALDTPIDPEYADFIEQVTGQRPKTHRQANGILRVESLKTQDRIDQRLQVRMASKGAQDMIKIAQLKVPGSEFVAGSRPTKEGSQFYRTVVNTGGQVREITELLEKYVRKDGTVVIPATPDRAAVRQRIESLQNELLRINASSAGGLAKASDRDVQFIKDAQGHIGAITDFAQFDKTAITRFRSLADEAKRAAKSTAASQNYVFRTFPTLADIKADKELKENFRSNFNQLVPQEFQLNRESESGLEDGSSLLDGVDAESLRKRILERIEEERALRDAAGD